MRGGDEYCWSGRVVLGRREVRLRREWRGMSGRGRGCEIVRPLIFASRGTKKVDCGPIKDTVEVVGIKIWFLV